MVDNSLASLGPLNQKFVKDTLVTAWEVAWVNRKKHKRNVDKDWNDAFKLVAAKHGFSELFLLTSGLARTISNFVMFDDAWSTWV